MVPSYRRENEDGNCDGNFYIKYRHIKKGERPKEQDGALLQRDAYLRSKRNMRDQTIFSGQEETSGN